MDAMTQRKPGGWDEPSKPDELEAHLLEEISRMPVIDTHEHLMAIADRRDRNTDVLREYLTHYMSSDLVSAGIPAADLAFGINPVHPFMDRWRRLEPWWEACRYTGYGRMLDRSVQKVYGIAAVRGDTVEALQEAFAKGLDNDHYRHVLRELCNIRLSVTECWDDALDIDADLFRRVWNPSLFTLEEVHAQDFRPLASRSTRRWGGKTDTLEHWVEHMERAFDEAIKSGVATIKLTTAYARSLHVGNTPLKLAREAFRDFADVMSGNGENDRNSAAPIELQDFMIRRVLALAAESGLPVQVHTGHFEGKPRDIRLGNPALLAGLFTDFPDVTFDLFHGGYPYCMEMAAIAKMNPNVHIDMCWMHVLSPNMARNALSEFLDAVPWTKISAFGGDCIFVDAVCGHLEMARENVAAVLADKVRNRAFGFDAAIRIAQAMFHDNPIRILNLGAPVGQRS